MLNSKIISSHIQWQIIISSWLNESIHSHSTQQHPQCGHTFTDTSTQTDWKHRDLQWRGTEKTTDRWIYFQRRVSCLSNKISSPTSPFPSLDVQYPKIKFSQITANSHQNKMFYRWILKSMKNIWRLNPKAPSHTAIRSEKLKQNISKTEIEILLRQRSLQSWERLKESR